jgi:16S rRNA (adenine1518-N6/adenine1519-N6)-dimethyltransferase
VLPLETGDVVIEIGPGRGAMTALLAARARKVIALEIDRELAHRMQADFLNEPRVQVVLADVLHVDFSALCEQEQVEQAFVFGNIPYYITSPILHHLFAQRNSIRSMGLLMQREVAERLVATPCSRDYGYLTVAAQTYSRSQIALAVPPGAFSPAPKVQSALVTFEMRAKFEHWPQEKCDAFMAFVKRCFAQKRKNLLNNLGGAYRRSQIVRVFDDAGKKPELRAEQLSIDELAEIFERLIRAA